MSMSDVAGTLLLADFLCIPKLKTRCTSVLDGAIDERHCLRALLLAERYCLTTSAARAMAFIATCFHVLAAGDAILRLDRGELARLLGDRRLAYLREAALFDLLVRWTYVDLAARRQHFSRLFGLVDVTRLSRRYLRDVVSTHPLVEGSQVSADVHGGHVTGHVLACSGSGGVLFCYVVDDDDWFTVPLGPAGSDCLVWSLACHAGWLYVLAVSAMYRLRPPRRPLPAPHIESVCAPTSLLHQRRRYTLVSHADSLLAVGWDGHVQRLDGDRWRVAAAGADAFVACPGRTMGVMLVPGRRSVYVLRTFSAGAAYSYAQKSFSIHEFDTRADTWSLLSHIDAVDLDMEEDDHLYGYSVAADVLGFTNELGRTTVQFDLVTNDWLVLDTRSEPLPPFVDCVYATVACGQCVFVVGCSRQRAPFLLTYDNVAQRAQMVADPPAGLLRQSSLILLPT